MTIRKVTMVGGVCGSITAIVVLGGMIWQGYNMAPVPDSVEEFHVEEHTTDRQQMNRTEGKLTALTIPPLVRAVKDDPCNLEMRRLLNERLDEYHGLMNREYRMNPLPECINPSQ